MSAKGELAHQTVAGDAEHLDGTVNLGSSRQRSGEGAGRWRCAASRLPRHSWGRSGSAALRPADGDEPTHDRRWPTCGVCSWAIALRRRSSSAGEGRERGDHPAVRRRTFQGAASNSRLTQSRRSAPSRRNGAAWNHVATHRSRHRRQSVHSWCCVTTPAGVLDREADEVAQRSTPSSDSSVR